MLIPHKGHTDTIQVYSVTVMTHVKALQAGHSSQGTFESITPAAILWQKLKKKKLRIDLKWREMRSKVIISLPKWPPAAILWIATMNRSQIYSGEHWSQNSHFPPCWRQSRHLVCQLCIECFWALVNAYFSAANSLVGSCIDCSVCHQYIQHIMLNIQRFDI